MKIEKKDLPKSEVEFKIIVDAEEFATYHAKGLAAIQQAVEVDGFRKGNAPENLIVKKYGDMIILEEMANLALRAAYVKAVEEHKVSPISDPQVTITKIAKGNPLELTIVVPILPEVELPKYKKIASEAVKDGEKIEVTDKDIEDVLLELRKGRANKHSHDHAHDHEGHDHEGHDHGDHEGHDHAHVEGAKSDVDVESQQASTQKNTEGDTEATLPELNDEFAQSFGDSFKNLADLKTKVGENIKLEKEQKLREKRRSAIMEKLIAETKTELPQVMIESELNTMLHQMKSGITRFGGTWEEYLTHTKKTEDEIKADWKDDAHKRAMSQLILHKIALAEKLGATEAEVEVELVRVLATVQDADEERAKAYLYQALTNDKVLAFLEKTEA